MDDPRPAPRYRAATWWGVLGFTAILLQALRHLVPLSLEPIRAGHVSPGVWVAYAVSIAFTGYSEGYRGFQRLVAPRIVVRALYLARHPTPVRVALAPLFCAGFFHASRRRLITTWIFYPLLVVVIIAVRQLPQPWRGVVDAGVVVGLTWGAIAILVFFGRALAGHPPAASAELPEGAEES
jgi:hypothetical protein